MATEKEVEDQLKEVMDPELNINIVDLGLIYEIEAGENIYIEMTLTTPGCPLHGVFDELVKEEVSKLEDVDKGDIEVDLTFEPRWTPDMMSDEAKDQLGHVPGMDLF
ncbi:MAG: metal-sulfur cluster assembly factor [Candidatus Nanohaloarchaea archaeon]